jgi:DNA modification methylase
MILATRDLHAARREEGGETFGPILIEDSAENLIRHAPFRTGAKADLVVTSPPYPGIHVLYHRWQVDGRKESPAPYWIAGCQDGRGDAFYNFADHRSEDDTYFERSLKTLKAIREVTKDGATMIQMLAFSEPRRQLPRYLANMTLAGFREIRKDIDLGYPAHRRIWRDVPRRSWHARMKGHLESAREVVLVHAAD